MMRFFAIPHEITLARRCGLAGAGLAVGAGALVCLWNWSKAQELRNKARKKRDTERNYISAELELLARDVDPDLMEKILELTAQDLLEELRKGNLKPIDVLEVYLYKACQVTGSLNCVTDIVRECRDAAKKLESENPKDLPLYGLPFSLKESFNTKGAASSVGLAKDIDKIYKDDCVIAKVMKKFGAVPFVKTNLPPMTMSFETSNPIYGTTVNPHNLDFTPGGSSGGEGAVLAAGASLLGFGTDIGGSVRVPAHFCGVCSLKPTKLRLSDIGVSGPTGTVGPMARDVDTLVLAMRTLLCDTMFEMDCNVPPMKFNQEIYSSKERLRIGYCEDNDFMEPIPACKRAVRITKQALEKAGHTLVPFKFSDVEYAMDNHCRVLFGDAGRSIIEGIRHEEIDPCLWHSYKWINMHPLIRRIYFAFLSFKSKRIGNALMAYQADDASVFSLHKVMRNVHAYKLKFWKEWKEKLKIDALICPLYPLVACPVGSLRDISMLMSYTIMFNMLDCPAGTVPVAKVTEKDIKDLDNHLGHYGDDWDLHCREACKDSINMPVGVQCVTPPWQEELCLRLMKEVEELLVK